MAPPSSFTRRPIRNLLIGISLLGLGFAAAIVILPIYLKGHFVATYPISFTINWVAARGERAGLSLYD